MQVLGNTPRRTAAKSEREPGTHDQEFSSGQNEGDRDKTQKVDLEDDGFPATKGMSSKSLERKLGTGRADRQRFS